MIQKPLPPGYSLWKFPDAEQFYEFAHITGHGRRHVHVHGGGVLAAIYDNSGTEDTEVAQWARAHGAKPKRRLPPTPLPPNQFLTVTDHHMAWIELPDGTTISVQPRTEHVFVTYWDRDGLWVDHALFPRLAPEAQ